MAVKQLIFLGFSVSQEYFRSSSKDDPFPQVAAYKYETRLLDGIQAAGVLVDRVVSVAATDYPKNKRIFFPGEKVDSAKGRRTTIALLNLPFFKLIFRFFGAFSWSARWRKQDSVLAIYSAHSPYLLAAWLHFLIFKTPYFVFVLDLPAYMNFQRRTWLFRFLKRCDSSLISFFLKKATGLIVASKYMVEDFRDRLNVPYLVVEGIASEPEPSIFHDEFDWQEEVSGRVIVTYAGGLNAAYGIRELVEGFLESSCEAELWLCGRGDLERYLAEKEVASSGRVRYLGFLPVDVVAFIQRSSSLLVLTRDPKEHYTRYSFPSKLLEYLVSGKPVLTTDLCGIPDDLRPYLNFIEEFSVAGISHAFRCFFATDGNESADKSERGRQYVLDNKGPVKQGRRIVDFIRSNV